MAKFEVVMPKLGESIIEATITKWLKQPGDTIEEDDPIVEIATDKVDSEIPSPVEGQLLEVLFKEGEVVEVGKIIAIIDTEPGENGKPEDETKADDSGERKLSESPEYAGDSVSQPKNVDSSGTQSAPEVDMEDTESDRFYSPLVKNIAKTEGISNKELEKVKGTGKDGRLTKNDLLEYLDKRGQAIPEPEVSQKKTQGMEQAHVEPSRRATEVTSEPDKPTSKQQAEPTKQVPQAQRPAPPVTANQGDDIVEMDRMRKLIADHMVMSKQVSPHVTSFIEVDVTNMVKWREKVKDEFQAREKEKITYTPIFVEAATQALKALPGVNASVDGYKVIMRKNINIGIAAALPNGNLIVPVIKNADQKSLLGLAKEVNNLADKARKNKLDPDDIQGGTFTITNLGTFGSITGSPIINQPQVAILGLGVIKKKPVVLETPEGDVIAIRHMVILSLAYDHRTVDGALGGMFLQKMQQILESFDINRTI
jgi:2-oxoglutarate dehydrogenase E2 component (dihydrolipoamide succinyltransferase)